MILDTEYNENGTPKHDPETGKTVHKVYWYSGVPDTINCNLECKEFLGDTRENGQKIHHGIREVLRDRNKEVMANYDILKQKWKDKEITKEEFEAEAKKNAADSTLTRPVVIIKPGPNTTYEALINALDEMKINQISRYNIQLPTAVDTTLIKMYGAKNGIPDIIKKNIRDNSIF